MPTLMRLLTGCLILAGWAGLAGLGGCAADGSAPRDWAAIVIDLEPADTEPGQDLTRTLERPWLGFGLAAETPNDEPPDISTLQVRLRTGPLDQADPRGDQLRIIEVRSAEIGRPRTAEGGLGGPLVIAVDPPAASLTLTGQPIAWPYKGDPGTVIGGMARITFHRGFVDAATDADPGATAQTLLRTALLGVETAAVRRYNQLDLQPTLDQIVALVQADIPPDTIRAYDQAGYRFSVQAFLALEAVGVEVDQAIAFADTGFALSADDLIRLRQNAVDPAYAAGLKQAGFADSVDQLVRLRTEGIEPTYARRMRELTVATDADDLVLLHRAAISPQAVEVFQQAGYDPDAQTLIALKRAGVQPADALALREAGYEFSLRDLMLLAKWRVPASFALALASEAYQHLSADQIVNLRLRRITPEMVRLLRQRRDDAATAEAAYEVGDEAASATDAQRAPVHPAVVAPPLSPLPPLNPAAPSDPAAAAEAD